VSPRGGQGLFVQGGYNGNLSNQGETIRLVTDQNVLIDTKTFGGDAPAINEIMTNNGTGNDWIELFNPTAGTFDLSDWHLSDSTTNATKYTIPAGTTVASGAYIVFTEAQFGSAFGMSKNGESVVLSNAAGTIIDSHDFNGSDVGVTFGRYTTREGLTSFTALTSPTPGSANSAALVGPVVINEIMYNSTVGNDEFIELKNITASPVKLYDTAAPAHTWTLSGGVDYTFPTGVEIPANALLILTEADVSTQPLKDAFRAKYAIPSDAQIFGPWQGSLNNGGEDININKVGRVDPGDGSYPVIRVDRVEYSPTYPWPSAADGTGKSLERISAASFGNDPFNWQSFRNGNPGYQALLQGDANRDGKVSFADYLVLEANFGKTGMTRSTGDFNNDGKVSFADYLILEADFGKSVPEPASLALLGLGGLFLRKRPAA
jgi:hypothetical protein